MVLHRVAHRGYSAVAPENTLPALNAAVRAGATFVEFDVRTTADGVPVVIHDRTVDRTTDGTGTVGELTLEQVRALDAGSWFARAHAGLRVPLLSEVLDLLRPYATPSELPPGIPSSGPALEGGSSGPALQVVSSELLLEIKRPATLDEVKAILAQVAERGLLERTIVQSFDPDVLRLAREVAPDVRRGLLRLRFDSETVPLAIELDVVCCNPSRLDVLGDPATVAALIDAGIAIMPWTANDMAEWPALVEAGVAGLITDRVGELTGWTSQP